MGRDARGRDFGKLKLWRCFGLNLVISPDLCMWIVPTFMTLGLFTGGLYTSWRRALTRWSGTGYREISFAGQLDLFLTCLLVFLALLFSALCGLTDPGAIPKIDIPQRQELIKREQERNNRRKKQQEQEQEGGGSVGDNNNTTTATTASASSSSSSSSSVSAEKQSLLEEQIQNQEEDRELDHLLNIPDERSFLQDWRALGIVDPYEDQKGWVECRSCMIRRPPRTSHCYTCGVCVLEHDHHCGVVGGCVGLRSLRFFASYLVCTALAALNTLSWVLEGLFDKTERSNPGSMAMHIMLLVFIGNIVLMVGGLACFYVYLVAVDLTRRENQSKKMPGPKTMVQHYHEYLTPSMLENQGKCLGNIRRVFAPPPSLICWEEKKSNYYV